METKSKRADRDGPQRLTRAKPDRNQTTGKTKQDGRQHPSYKPYDYETAYNHTMDMLDEAEAMRLINELRCPVYATKTIKAGTKMDVEVYPEYTRLPAEIQREPKSREAQRNLNDANSRKACERLVNANFTERDCWLTLSYDDLHLPDCIERAQKDAQNWIKRVNRRRAKLGHSPARYVYVIWLTLSYDDLHLPDCIERAQKDAQNWIKRVNRRRAKLGHSPARYVYVIEHGESQSKHRRVRCHIHVVMDGELPMEEALALWTCGQRNHARRLAFDENGLSGLAQYITKDSPTARKKWCASKGLRRPVEHKNHRTFRRRRVEKLALSPGLMCTEMEKQYPGYWFIRGDVRWNGFNGQFYLSAKMRRRALPGDLVKLSGPADALAQIPPDTTRRLGSRELLVVDTDNTPGRETATVKYGAHRYILPGRAAVVVQIAGR